jgi:dCTP diphosphatase
MNDDQTTIAQLKQMLTEFVTERDWQQFHSPKNLAMSISIEAAELMEHFQWIDIEDSRKLADDLEKREQVGEEMCDVLAYLVSLANEMKIDLASAFTAKMKKNRLKYPAAQFQGRYKKSGEA